MFAFHFIFQMSNILFFKIVFRDFKTRDLKMPNIDLKPAFLPQIVFGHFTLYFFKIFFLCNQTIISKHQLSIIRISPD